MAIEAGNDAGADRRRVAGRLRAAQGRELLEIRQPSLSHPRSR